MSQDEYRVATGPTEWVTVKTAEEALRLGKRFSELVADVGVYKAERDRLAAENERLRGNILGHDAMIMGRDSIIKCRDEEIERLRKLLGMYLKADPLIGEAVASAMLADKEGKSV